MGSNNGMELNLDLNSGEFIVHKKTAASDSPAPAVGGGDDSLKLSKLSYFLHALEEESRKIDAFKRELPFSMLIITHAIEKVKEEVLGIKGKLSDDDGFRFRPGEIKKEGGAFHPYKRIPAAGEEAELARCDGGGGGGASSVDERRLKSRTGGGVNNVLLPRGKKQRRCWSPELHRRFVDALHQLGGAHAATPKRIIDIMRVDGLTNDEVKSHLQKYRLHVRRLPIGPSMLGPTDLKATQYN